MPVLRVKAGAQKGQIFKLEAESIVLGRDCAEDGIQVLDQGASRRHGELFRIGDMWFLRDLQSRNGIFLNEEQVIEELLQIGDQIRIGGTIFVLEEDGSVPQPTPAEKAEAAGVMFDDSDDSDDGGWGQTIVLDLDSVKKMTASDSGMDGREYRNLSVFYDVSKTLSGEKSLDKLFGDFLEIAGKAVEADAAYIVIREGKKFSSKASWFLNPDTPKSQRPPISSSIVRRTIEIGKPIMTSDASQDSRFSGQQSIVLKKVRSVICAPLKSRDQIHGACYLALDSVRSFLPEDLELVTAIALQLGTAFDGIKSANKLRQSVFRIVRAMVGLIEKRDPKQKGRSTRVMNTAAAIGQELKLSSQQRYWIELAALLHDVGRLAINEEDFDTEDERYEAVVKNGEQFLADIQALEKVVPGIKYQFARFDGTGWPTDVRPADVPLIGKIICVARDFEVASSKLSGLGETTPIKSVLMDMGKSAGTRYDAKVIKALLLAAKSGSLFNPKPLFKDLFGDELD